MKSIKLFTGPFESLYYFSTRVETLVKAGKYNFLVFLPVNRAVRYYKKRLVDTAPNRAMIDPPVFTFDEALTRLYRRLPHSKKIIDSDMFLMMIEDILNQHGSDFRFFTAGTAVSSGLIRKTGDMIKELRRFGYNGTAFSKLAIPERDYDELKFRDFERLLKMLDERLGERYIDEPFARHQAALHFSEEIFRSVFPGTEHIFISGYGLFTPAMFLFIEKVSRWAEVNIKLEYDKANPALFRHTIQAAKRIMAMNAQVQKSNTEGYLARFLFNPEPTAGKKKDFTNRIEIQALSSRREEVAFIAAKIRELHFEHKIPLHRFAVTFANLERYVPDIRRVFRDFDLPINLSTGFPLIQSPLVRQFLNTLQAIANGFPLESVFQLLQSPFTLPPASMNPDYLYRLLVKYRLRHLSPGWEQRLTQAPEYQNSADRPEEENLPFQMRLLQEYLAPYYSVPHRKPVAVFYEQLKSFWKNIGLFDWYRLDSRLLTERQKENEFRAFNRFISLLEKLVWILQELQGQKEITLSYFIGVIQNSVEQTVYNLTEWPDYGVQIMPRLEILAVDSEVLFIGGMVDGEFPRASTKDIFFNDRVRSEMGLIATEELLDQDRFLFYILLNAPKGKIILTYPRYEEESALVPSTFLNDLEEIAMVTHHQALPEDSRFLNKQRLWLNLGLSLQQQNYDEASRWLQLIATNAEESADLEGFFQRLQAMTQRYLPDRFSEYEGLLSSDAALKRLQSKYTQTTWSASRLESYAFCPMRFFFSHILELEDLPQIEDEVSAQERGSMTHRILYRFYRELKQKNQTRHPERHWELLQTIAQQELAGLPYRGIFLELERLRLLGSAHKKGVLQAFIETDQREIEATGFEPAYFELGFGSGGTDEKDAASQTQPVVLKSERGQLKLTGRIDRVDVDAEGRALVWDYKTGNAAKAIDVFSMAKGYYLQLPLYLLALSQIQPELRPVLGGYFLVSDASSLKRKAALADAGEVDFVTEKKALLPHPKAQEAPATLDFEAFLHHMLTLGFEAVERLLQGRFHHTFFPKENACSSYCPYRRMCQKNVGKLMKMAEELQGE